MTLVATAQALMARGKGLLAMDESGGTIGKRFGAAKIPDTEETRRAYRELLVTTPGLGDSISGAILFDETIRQSTKAGKPFVDVLADAGIIPGIKVDLGAVPLAGHPDETITEGLDGLRARLKAYYGMGARFAKWRGVLRIGAGIPSRACIAVNADALARYAALCQEAMLVPIVEPEVLMDGDHTLERCGEVTQEVLHVVFRQLHLQGVQLEGMLLKPNMVVPGLACGVQDSVDAVSAATLQCLLRSVPAAVAGIAFLSGGQADDVASARLNAMNAGGRSLPWPVSFSYGRALQDKPLGAWAGSDANVAAAQQALLKRARCNSAAQHGTYSAAMESA